MAISNNRFKEMRKAKGQTQREIAAIIGMTPEGYSYYENGKRGASIETIMTLAKFYGVTTDYLLRKSDTPNNDEIKWIEENSIHMSNLRAIPVLGSVKAGFGLVATEENEGYEYTNADPENCFFLRVTGDSMEPTIPDGALALVNKALTIESGDIVVAIINGEEGSIKRIIYQKHAIALESFNPTYRTRVFIGSERTNVHIVGKVVETQVKKSW